MSAGGACPDCITPVVPAARGQGVARTLLHELERADKELGLVTMCTAGGNGTGTLIQRI